MLLYGLENDQDFGHIHHRLLVSCPSSGFDIGGLFLLDFSKNSIEKLYNGSCSGIAVLSDRIVLSSDENQLVELNKEFQFIRKTQFGKLDFHDIVAWGNNVVLVVETATNAIGCYETDTFSRIGELRFNPATKDVHHINDIWLDGHLLYVSMFSASDRWYLDPMKKNGSIALIDLANLDPYKKHEIEIKDKIIKEGLFMPHSVMIHEQKLAYCDSMSFQAVMEREHQIQLPGFTRGLAITDQAIFIGQSRMRHILRIPHQFTNCCLDGGIFVYNPVLRISRFVSIPAHQVYQIVVLDQ